MAYCGPRGIPRGFFLGGSNLWTQADRDAALAWQEMQRQTCQCGTREEEWQLTTGGHPAAYAGEIASCPGCAEIERTEARAEKETPGLKGRKVWLRRRSPAELAELSTRRRRRG